MKNEVALVYMVAGISKRFGGAIKAFARVGKNRETLIEVSLGQALPAGFTKIIFIVSEATRPAFFEFFGDSYNRVPIYYAVQDFDKEKRKKPWGTADSVCSARDLIDCPFVVCNGDDLYGCKAFLTLAQHLHTYKEEGAALGYRLMDVLSPTGEVNRAVFGIIDNHVTTIKEVLGITKDNFGSLGLREDDLYNMNIFALHREMLSLLQQRVDTFKKEHEGEVEGECYLPHEISSFLLEDRMKMRMYPAEDMWLGITNPGDERVVKEKLASIGLL